MSDYPASERQNCGYAIRFIKVLLNSDAIHDHGTEAVLLAVFIASREDKMHYRKAPQFWRAELMDRFGTASPKGFVRIRTKAIEAGLLHYTEGTRVKPGQYWTLVPDWLEESFEAFRKRNGSSSKRSENDPRNGTANDPRNGTLSNTHNPLPNKEGATGVAVSSEKKTSKRKPKFDAAATSLPEVLNTDRFRDVWSEWTRDRADRHKPITEAAANRSSHT